MRVLRREAFAALPEAVLWDLDHTLYDYEHPHAQAMAAAREKLRQALDVTGQQFDSAFASARRQTKLRLGGTASSHSRLLYFQATIELLGYGPQLLLALDLEQTYWRSYLRAASLAPGAEDVLIELRAAGAKLAVVTDLTAQIQFRKLVHFGLERYFDAVVTSEEAGTDKVGLAPFTLALSKLGVQPGARVWMVGDTKDDIEGSRRAVGAVTVQKLWSFGRSGAHRDADAVVHDFGDLLAFLRRRS